MVLYMHYNISYKVYDNRKGAGEDGKVYGIRNGTT